MKYQQEQIIYCPDKSESEVIEKLKRELPKKCGLYINGHILVLTSRMQIPGGGYGSVTGSTSRPMAPQISATIQSDETGSIVKVEIDKPAVSFKGMMLIMILGLLVAWLIGYVLHIAPILHMPNNEGILPLTVFFGGWFFICHSWDHMLSAQKKNLFKYLKDALKQ
jgi:hypothetical protein